MKIRNSFISNSSSSSFITIGSPKGIPSRITYAKLSRKLAIAILEDIISDAKKYDFRKDEIEGLEKSIEKIKSGVPAYLTQFVSDCIDDYGEVQEKNHVHWYCSGAHAGPYDEENYIRIAGEDIYGGVYIPTSLAHLITPPAAGQMEFDFVQDELDPEE